VKRKRKIKGPFVAVPKAILNAPAWRTMSPEGRLLWIDLRGWLRNDGLNNGKVLRSCRDAAESIGLSKNTVARRFAELRHYGFLRKTAPGFLGSDGRGIAAKYRFTDLAHGTNPPTRDYEKWDGELFAYTPRRAGSEKQNPVPPRGTYAKPRGVPPRGTYGRSGRGAPYVPPRGTYAKPRGVPPRGTYLDCHSPAQGMRGYRVA
jgi:DNA-binding transcriptional MocR family regulator